MIESTFRKVWHHSPLTFPEFSRTRVMMMPVKLGDLAGVPEPYGELVAHLYGVTENRFHGSVGYLTIDEKHLGDGATLRRAGRHVDGFYQGKCGAWGGGGGWGSVGNGMLTISSTPHCRAWLGTYDAEPGPDGGCDHITMQGDGVLFEAGQVYWVDGACIHESVPVSGPTARQFVRLSMPSNGPWFEGYTPNPTGVLPSHAVLPPRTFMTA